MSTPVRRVVGEGRHRKRDVPILICCHHKVGTILWLKVAQALCAEFGWSYRFVLGRIDVAPTDADLVLFLHSLVDLGTVRVPYTGVHFVRDPRDVIVSGYLYHLRCNEPWCVNEDLQPSAPIQFPQVPYSQEFRSEAWKKQYLRSLQGKSYQENLRSLDQREGLLFEMQRYGGWTIDSMLEWDYARPNMLELRFETLMTDYDATFARLFDHFRLSADERPRAMRIAAEQDLGRMSEAEVAALDHVTSRQTSRWASYFEDEHKQAFRSRFGDALVRLGYESSNDW